MTEGTGEVWTDWDFKRVIAITHAQTNEAHQAYYHRRLNNAAATKQYDIFLANLSRLYADIRPFLQEILKEKKLKRRTIKKEDIQTLTTFIRVMDKSRQTNRRLKPTTAVTFFDLLTTFLKEWGLLDIEQTTPNTNTSIETI
ncbi:hypothetical protein LCGC14_2775640 [marine sediment metagenome]|uniref:Uncharacterized protein n=1 Tax=marine sediment metagenome TaxID=412755 RepID=A0A0F8ZGR7_9ZZZZ